MTVSLPGVGTKAELSGVWWAEAQEFPGFPSLCPGTWYALGQGWHGIPLRTQILVLGDGEGEPESWPSPVFSLSLACSWLPNAGEAQKGWQEG